MKEYLESSDEQIRVSNILNESKVWIKIERALGIEIDTDSGIFSEIEEFIVEKFEEMENLRDSYNYD